MMPDRLASLRPLATPMRMVLADGRTAGWPAVAGAAQSVLDGLLPGNGPIVNLCDDRFSFLTMLVAAAVSGRASILPSDRSPEGLRSIAIRYPGSVAHCDSGALRHRAAAAGLEADLVQLRLGAGASGRAIDPAILEDAKVVMFTSGSTGMPEPCVRKMSFFREGAVANALCMFEGFDDGASIVATVPPYHMFGFELSVTVPLFAGATLYSGRPFFPADVATALESMPSPRILVSTPVHLRALKESGLPMPAVGRVFSATAPLSRRLARDVESLFRADLREIFGTTETGSIGWRKTAMEDSFHLMHGMELTRNGSDSLIAAPHIAPPFLLADRLEQAGDGKFRLAGRSNDIVNIAGKRMSLAGMNIILSSLDGVADGAFLAPGDDAEGPVERMSAVVVAPGRTVDDIRQSLRDKLDSAFIPRRIAFVDALPRNEAGKLPLEEFRRFAIAALAGTGKAERRISFTTDEPWARDHFPGQAIVPGAVLLGEAIAFLADWLGEQEAPARLVNARFPDSAIPGEDCLLRIEPASGGQHRIECSQGDRIVLRATMRLPGPSDG